MSIDQWLAWVSLDAERRDLAALRPILEALARSTAALRAAPWNHDASDRSPSPPRNDR